MNIGLPNLQEDEVDAAKKRPVDLEAGSRRPYFTRSRLVSDSWKAAGVLPFASHDGHCWALLGGEIVRTGPNGKHRQLMWRDFGGQREAIDEDSIDTASRECSEETLGMLFGCSSVDRHAVERSKEALMGQLRDSSCSMCTIHQLKKGAYHMFICRSSFVDPLMFALATEQNMAKPAPLVGAEKILFAWVMMVDLLKVVSSIRKSYFLNKPRRIVARGFGDQQVPRKLMLHPCFARSLRTAVESGLVALLKSCQEVPKVISPQDRDSAVSPESKDAMAAAAPAVMTYVSEPVGPAPMHMWWTLLQHDVAKAMDIEVPLEAARYAELVQGSRQPEEWQQEQQPA